MPDVLGSLCVLSIGLALLTILGHGLWLMAASILRPLFGSSEPSHSPGVSRDIDARIVPVLMRLNDLRRSRVISTAQYEQIIQVLRGEEEHAEPEPVAVGAPQAVDATAAEAATDLGVPPPHPAFEHPTPSEASLPSVSPIEVIDAEVVSHKDELHPLDRTDVPSEVPSRQARHSRALADVLQAFMEQRNIRWVELVGGLLIVGCALGLVISIQATLRTTIPYFPALIFLLVTAAIHGAGLYTLRRWKLETTSRGVLAIVMLLIPLNVTAAIAMSGQQEQLLPVTDWRYILAVLIGIVAYGLIAFSASRALVGRRWWLMATPVLGASVGQVLIHRLLVVDPSWTRAQWLFALPALTFVLGTGGQLFLERRRLRLSTRRAEQMLLILGIAAFAVSVAAGVFVAWAGDHSRSLALLSPALCLISSVILGNGLLVHQRAARDTGLLQTAGTALAVFGMLLSIGAVVAAWPAPNMLLLVGSISGLAYILLAIATRLPLLQVGAIVHLTLAACVGYPVVRGAIPWELTEQASLIAVLLAPSNSLVLTVLAVGAGVVSLALGRLPARTSSLVYAGGAAGLGALSVLVACYAGFLSPMGAASSIPSLVLAGWTCAALAAAMYRQDARITWAGSALALLTLLHLFLRDPYLASVVAVQTFLAEDPVVLALLTHAVFMTGVALAAAVAGRRDPRRSVGRYRDVITPLGLSAAMASVAITPWVLRVSDFDFGRHATFAAVLTALWLILSVLQRLPILFRAAQGMSLACLAMTLWYLGLRDGTWNGEWLDPGFLPRQLLAGGVWCAAWLVARTLLTLWPRARRAVQPARFGLDPLVALVLLGGLVVLAVHACRPGIVDELTSTYLNLPTPGSYGPIAWGAWAVLLAVLVAYRQVFARPEWLAAVLLCGALSAWFFAPLWHVDHAVASALRWGLGGYALAAGSLLIGGSWWRGRRDVAWQRLAAASRTAVYARALWLLLMTAGPILALSTVALVAVLEESYVGPVGESLFGSLLPVISYGIPLACVALITLLLSAQHRAPLLALIGSLLLQAAVILGYAIQVALDGGALLPIHWAALLQWSSVALAGYSLAWLLLARWIEPRLHRGEGADVQPASAALDLQVALVLFALFGLASWSALLVAFQPGSTQLLALLGDWPGYLAWGLGFGAVLAYGWRYRDPNALHFAIASAAMLVAISSASWAAESRWAGYHWLTGGLVVLAGLTAATPLLWRWLGRRREEIDGLRIWSWICTTAAVVLALHAQGTDPWIYWPPAVVLALGLMHAAVAAIERGLLARYAATALLLLATALVCYVAMQPMDGQEVLVTLDWLAIVASLSGIAWLGVHLLQVGPLPQPPGLPIHRLLAPTTVLAVLALAGLAMLVSTSMRLAGRAVSFDLSDPLGFTAVGISGLFALSLLWDSRNRGALVMLYLWSIAAALLLLDQIEDLPLGQTLEQRAARTEALMGLAAGLHLAIAGAIWKRRPQLAQYAERLGVLNPGERFAATWNWLQVAVWLSVLFLVTTELFVVLFTEERSLRILGGLAPAIAALGLAAFADAARASLRTAALYLATLAAVYLSWADLGADPALGVLPYLVRVLVVLCSLAFVYSVLLPRWLPAEHTWRPAVRRVALGCSVLALAVLPTVLLAEGLLFEPGIGVALTAPQIAAVAVVLALLSIALVVFAIVPGRDPWELSEQGRMAYVYAAQATITLLFVHIYLTRPYWFSGLLRPYWPYILLTIAFAGVGLGEILRRRGLRVLAEPLQRTGGLLPLLPAIGFWVLASENQLSFQANGISYSAVLFWAGLLYLLVAFWRRSLLSGLAAALAGNGALWVLLNDSGFELWNNPQLWMIPPAICGLLAAQLNRDRLTPAQSASIRYLCGIVIYVSSTSEMLIRGIGDSLWPPMILMLLSVCGVLAGMLLQIRAFLYLGTSFLMVAILSMVWHASTSIQHSWPWWAFGIALGLGILTVFGIFEKKRLAVMELIERLRHWEG